MSDTDLDLTIVRRLLGSDKGLSVVSVSRPDGTVSSSLVNAGLLAHPVDGSIVLGLVVRQSAYKYRRLQAQPRATIIVTRGWQWQAVEGAVELIGPDQATPAAAAPGASSAAVAVPALLRDVFRAAGGTHDNWEEFDRVMVEERRAAVLVRPERVYGVASD